VEIEDALQGTGIHFGQYRELAVYGRLLALGTAQQPILFTGTTANKGWWSGIRFQAYSYSDAPSTGSRLDYVTVEYRGNSYDDISASWSQVSISPCTSQATASSG